MPEWRDYLFPVALLLGEVALIWLCFVRVIFLADRREQRNQKDGNESH